MTYIVEQGSGYEVGAPGSIQHQIHQTGTDDVAYCCDGYCARRYMAAIGLPPDTAEPGLAGQWIDVEEDERGDRRTISWGEAPCSTSSHHEYCPACGSLELHGEYIEDNDPPCDGSDDSCEWPRFCDPDPCMAR